MAFKERFKDRNIITGKNGENAQLAPTGPVGSKKGAGKELQEAQAASAGLPLLGQQQPFSIPSAPNSMAPMGFQAGQSSAANAVRQPSVLVPGGGMMNGTAPQMGIPAPAMGMKPAMGMPSGQLGAGGMGLAAGAGMVPQMGMGMGMPAPVMGLKPGGGVGMPAGQLGAGGMGLAPGAGMVPQMGMGMGMPAPVMGLKPGVGLGMPTGQQGAGGVGLAPGAGMVPQMGTGMGVSQGLNMASGLKTNQAPMQFMALPANAAQPPMVNAAHRPTLAPGKMPAGLSLAAPGAPQSMLPPPPQPAGAPPVSTSPTLGAPNQGVRLSQAPRLQQQASAAKGAAAGLAKAAVAPLPAAAVPTPTFAMVQQPTAFMGGMPMMAPGGFPPPTSGPTNIGSYDYAAAQDPSSVPAVQTKAEPKHGRRAMSTDPTARGPGGEDDRPTTDPQKPHYKAYTLEDYRKMKEETAKMVLRKGLGPVDNEEVRAEREKRQKMLEYAANAHKINKALDAPQDSDEEEEPRPIVQPVAQEVLEAQQRREKALQFAKNVPKPKVKPKEEEKVTSAPTANAQNLDELAKAGDLNFAKRDKEKVLMDLEAKHKRDQQMIENIKKQLKLA